MKNLKYSLVVESTADRTYFSAYPPELEGFSGSGTSIEACLVSEIGMIEHVQLLEEAGLTMPPCNPNPAVRMLKSEQVIPAA